jgi:hypothetical protein
LGTFIERRVVGTDDEQVGLLLSVELRETSMIVLLLKPLTVKRGIT